MMFQNDFYAEDENGEVYLADAKGNVLTKKANNKSKLVCGVGKNDWKYVICGSDNSLAPVYRCWTNMLVRGYDEKFNSRQPTYTDVTVCSEWRNSFTVFFQDVKPYIKKGYQLDKDILYFGNKEYSKRACIFVPQWLNTLLNDCGSARGLLPQGVIWDDYSGKYQVSCAVDGRRKHLGRFTTTKEASDAYVEFKIAYIESKRSEIEAIAKHNDLHIRFSPKFSLTDRVIENFKKIVQAYINQMIE